MIVIDRELDLFILEDDDYPTPIIFTARYYPSNPGKPMQYGSEGIIDWGEPPEYSYVDIEQIWIRRKDEDIPCNNDIIYGTIDDYEVCQVIENWLNEY